MCSTDLADNRRGSQDLLQRQRLQLRIRGRFPNTKIYFEHCHGIPVNFQHTDCYPSQNIPRQHHGVVQVHAPTSGNDDAQVENLYDLHRNIINQNTKQDIIVVLGDWNENVGEYAQLNWQSRRGCFCGAATNHTRNSTY